MHLDIAEGSEVIDFAIGNRRNQAINLITEASGCANTALLVLGIETAKPAIDGAGNKMAEAVARDTFRALESISPSIAFQPREAGCRHAQALVVRLTYASPRWCTRREQVQSGRWLRQHLVAVVR